MIGLTEAAPLYTVGKPDVELSGVVRVGMLTRISARQDLGVHGIAIVDVEPSGRFGAGARYRLWLDPRWRVDGDLELLWDPYTPPNPRLAVFGTIGIRDVVGLTVGVERTARVENSFLPDRTVGHIGMTIGGRYGAMAAVTAAALAVMAKLLDPDVDYTW